MVFEKLFNRIKETDERDNFFVDSDRTLRCLEMAVTLYSKYKKIYDDLPKNLLAELESYKKPGTKLDHSMFNSVINEKRLDIYREFIEEVLIKEQVEK